ncbi:MAG: PhzF family phenazine biosynthesis protein [Bacteroidales bacterium]|nr:PhzF family phenazine biosynthesis protein [Bacteroidales bacterium]
MAQYPYYILDVFTTEMFGGNQLAVFPDATGIPEKYLQSVAREFNFSETTFVYPPVNKRNDLKLRIFTPGVEVPMAGHPTIGTAYVLLSLGLIKPKHQNHIVIEEKVGNIRVDFVEGKAGFHSITMNQPLPVFGKVEENKKMIAQILSIQEQDIDERYPMQCVSCGNNFLFIPLISLSVMHKINVKTDLLKAAKNQLESTELFVFSNETIYPSSDYHCRMFAPLFGIYEDPATGSAAGPFGSYLVKNRISEKNRFICEQGFEMTRPSIIRVEIEGKAEKITGVKVSGDAVLVCEGKMRIG